MCIYKCLIFHCSYMLDHSKGKCFSVHEGSFSHSLSSAIARTPWNQLGIKNSHDQDHPSLLWGWSNLLWYILFLNGKVFFCVVTSASFFRSFHFWWDKYLEPIHWVVSALPIVPAMEQRLVFRFISGVTSTFSTWPQDIHKRFPEVRRQRIQRWPTWQPV